MMGNAVPGTKKKARHLSAPGRTPKEPHGGCGSPVVEEIVNLREQSAVPEGRQFPTGNTVAGQQRGQH
jgi:hypothetical protein